MVDQGGNREAAFRHAVARRQDIVHQPPLAQLDAASSAPPGGLPNLLGTTAAERQFMKEFVKRKSG